MTLAEPVCVHGTPINRQCYECSSVRRLTERLVDAATPAHAHTREGLLPIGAAIEWGGTLTLRCRKCLSTKISTRYCNDPTEQLKHICECGFHWLTPCADAETSAIPVENQLHTTQIVEGRRFMIHKSGCLVHVEHPQFCAQEGCTPIRLAEGLRIVRATAP